MKIIYDKDLTDLVLDAFGKTTNDEGYLVEKTNPTQKVLTRDGEELHKNNFGGVKKGSEIFVNSDLVSIMNLCRHIASKTGA